jgi:hypothetical protein
VNYYFYNFVHADIYQCNIAIRCGHGDLCYGTTFSCCINSCTFLNIEQFYLYHFINSGLECEGEVSTFWDRNRCFLIRSLDYKDSTKGRVIKRLVHFVRFACCIITGIHESGKVFACCVRAIYILFDISINNKTIEGVIANIHMISVLCRFIFVIFIEGNSFVVTNPGRRRAWGCTRRGTRRCTWFFFVDAVSIAWYLEFVTNLLASVLGRFALRWNCHVCDIFERSIMNINFYRCVTVDTCSRIFACGFKSTNCIHLYTYLCIARVRISCCNPANRIIILPFLHHLESNIRYILADNYDRIWPLWSVISDHSDVI